MPMSMRYEMRHDYLNVEVTGQFAHAEALRQFTEIMEWISGKDVRRILMDCRSVKGTLTTIERYEYGAFIAAEIARFAAAGRASKPRLAYVLSREMLDKDHLAQTVASNRGAVVTTTDSMDDALRWLSVGGTG